MGRSRRGLQATGARVRVERARRLIQRGESKLVQPGIFSGAPGNGAQTFPEAGEYSGSAGLRSYMNMQGRWAATAESPSAAAVPCIRLENGGRNNSTIDRRRRILFAGSGLRGVQLKRARLSRSTPLPPFSSSGNPLRGWTERSDETVKSISSAILFTGLAGALARTALLDGNFCHFAVADRQ